jgi:hypothetical protein
MDTNAETNSVDALTEDAREVRPDEIAGTWTSGVRETKHGAMTFRFRLGSDGLLEVIGIPTSGSSADVFRRSGPYRLMGDQLVSPALNKGQPIEVRLHAGVLVLWIEETLVFHLRRG